MRVIKESIKELIEFIVEDERLFYVKKLKNGESMVDDGLLGKIDRKISQWWSREYDEVRK